MSCPGLQYFELRIPVYFREFPGVTHGHDVVLFAVEDQRWLAEVGVGFILRAIGQ